MLGSCRSTILNSFLELYESSGKKTRPKQESLDEISIGPTVNICELKECIFRKQFCQICVPLFQYVQSLTTINLKVRRNMNSKNYFINKRD